MKQQITGKQALAILKRRRAMDVERVQKYHAMRNQDPAYKIQITIYQQLLRLMYPARRKKYVETYRFREMARNPHKAAIYQQLYYLSNKE